MAKEFDNQLADAQATHVLPVKPEDFDFEMYASYASNLTRAAPVSGNNLPELPFTAGCGWGSVFLTVAVT